MKKVRRILLGVSVIFACSVVFTSCKYSTDTRDALGGGGTIAAVPSYIVLPSETDGTAGTSATYVTFGTWPQSKKEGSITVDEGNSKTVGMFTYYKGSDGEWYAKKNSDYYKVEPIKWRVLTDSYNGNKLFLAENALMPCTYSNGDNNNYEHSGIRAWLNGIAYYNDKGFLQTAFTTEEQAKIATTPIDNSEESTNPDGSPTLWNSGTNQYACANTSDKIFLLSVKEATTSRYGFAAYDVYIGDANGTTTSTRLRVPTDFAVANGAYKSNTTAGAVWWLRSPDYITMRTRRAESSRAVSPAAATMSPTVFASCPLCV